MVPYFSDPRVGAVQGRVSVLNEGESWIARITALERIEGYRVSQYARDKLGLLGVICLCVLAGLILMFWLRILI